MSANTMLPESMLHQLLTVLLDLKQVLENNTWKSMFIDYEMPHVERLWTDYNPFGKPHRSCRIYLHKIHPATIHDTVFYHPHPWPSAMMIFGSGYETGVGYGDPKGMPPPKIGPFYFSEWSFYQMTSPNDWHYVRPINKPAYTLMVTGTPFPKDENTKREKPEHRLLTFEEAQDILSFFKGVVSDGFDEKIKPLVDIVRKIEEKATYSNPNTGLGY